MIGQARLFKTLDSYTLENLPKSLLFLGEEGCGKRSFVKYLAKRLSLELVQLSNDIDVEQLIECQQSLVPKMFLIDLRDFTEKQQNKLLKFVEEPSKNVYISLTANSELLVLPTILSRCIQLRFEPYSKEQLKQLDWLNPKKDERMYEICKTPGQLNVSTSDEIEKLLSLCKLVVDNISRCRYANLLSISTKFNYKDEYDKLNYTLFFEILKYFSSENFINTGDEISFKIFKITSQYQKKVQIFQFIKENYMLNFLTTLWTEVRKCI